jgi:hypothetical protein
MKSVIFQYRQQAKECKMKFIFGAMILTVSLFMAIIFQGLYHLSLMIAE